MCFFCVIYYVSNVSVLCKNLIIFCKNDWDFYFLVKLEKLLLFSFECYFLFGCRLLEADTLKMGKNKLVWI